MNILLINPPKEKEFALFTLKDYSTKARSNQIPIGLLYLQSYLKDRHNVEVFDMNALELPISAIEDEIDKFQPDLIGITVTIAKWNTVRGLARFVKENCRVPVIAGGVNPSLYPWETLQCNDIDYVISGFGQKPLEILCHRLELEQPVEDIPNVYTNKNCTQDTKGTFEFVNIDEFPMPDRSILPIDDYEMPFFPENPASSMITSMGCPYKCSFCACKNFKPVRLRTVENIIKEMKHVESLGIRSVLFNDELFTMSIGRIHDICSAIIFNDIKLHWGVRSRANLVHKESLELMKEAGCFNIHLGIESGTDRILGEMEKGIDIETIKESVNTIKDVGLSCTASFMIGYPDETHDEIMETIQLAQDLDLNTVQLYITQPEPCTKLYDQVYPDGNLYSDFTLNPDSVDLTQNIASKIFTKEQLERYLEIGYERTPNLYTVKGY